MYICCEWIHLAEDWVQKIEQYCMWTITWRWCVVSVSWLNRMQASMCRAALVLCITIPQLLYTALCLRIFPFLVRRSAHTIRTKS